MRLRSSSLSVVNRGQSLEYEQQAPQELQAPRKDIMRTILSALVALSVIAGVANPATAFDARDFYEPSRSPPMCCHA